MRITKTGWEYLRSLNEVCKFTSRQIKGQTATNSELKRWCQEKVLRINGVPIDWDDSIPLPEDIHSVTLFTKKNTVTIL